jgi:uncharacterized protein (DUF427 family)
MEISKAQRVSVDMVVKHFIEDERRDLEETLYTMFDDIEFDSMTNKKLNTFCEEKGVVHIWNYLYDLSLIG